MVLRKRTQQHILFFIIALVILLINFWKSTKGIGVSDEHFYTTLGYRFYLGDAMFYDDWHIAQMIGIFIYPFVALFQSIFKSNDGIILFMRLVYSFFVLLVGTFFYVRFNKKGYVAIFSSVVYMLFTPFNIMALSYNTMGVGFLLLALSVKPYSFKNKMIKTRYFISGIFFSLSVLNSPYLALLYFLYGIFVVFLKIKKIKPWFDFELTNFIFFTSGIFLSACIFMIVILKNTSVAQILSTIPFLIDPSHSNGLYIFFVTLIDIIKHYNIFIFIYLCIFMYIYIKRGKIKNKNYIVLSCVISFVIYLIYHYFANYQNIIGGYSLIFIPVTVIGLITFILLEKKDYQIFLCFLVIPLIYAILISLSSNVRIRAFCNPLVISSMISVIFFYQFYKENFSKTLFKIFCLFVITLLSYLFMFKINYVYGYIPMSDLNTLVTKGPLKGLYGEIKEIEAYNRRFEDMQKINSLPTDSIMLITNETWMYLASTKKPNVNSTYLYLWQLEEYEDIMSKYLEIHSDKKNYSIYLDYSNQYKLEPDSNWMKQFKKEVPLNMGYLFISE